MTAAAEHSRIRRRPQKPCRVIGLGADTPIAVGNLLLSYDPDDFPGFTHAQIVAGLTVPALTKEG